MVETMRFVVIDVKNSGLEGTVISDKVAQLNSKK